MKRKCENSQAHRPPPFALDPTMRKGLVAQTVDGLRRAIETGYYAAGDVLPSVREIAAALGVSVRVPRDAIAELTEGGMLNSRTGVGAVVMERHARVWKGRVLFVLPEAEGSFYPSVLAGEIQRRMTDAGYLFTRLSTSSHDPSKTERDRLSLALSEQTDLALVFTDSPAVQRLVSRAGVPFVVIDAKPCRLKGCVGNVRFFREGGIPALVGRAAALGVRSALCLTAYAQSQVSAALSGAGVASETLTLAPTEGIGRLDGMQAMAAEAISRRFSPGRPRPDLVVFEDDHFAFGGLLALARLGVRVPEEVRVVAWANAGFSPYGPIDRVTMDPVAHGAAVAAALLAHLSGGGFPLDLSLAPAYCPHLP